MTYERSRMGRKRSAFYGFNFKEGLRECVEAALDRNRELTGQKMHLSDYVNRAILLQLRRDKAGYSGERLVMPELTDDELLISSLAGVDASDITVISSQHVEGDTGEGAEGGGPSEAGEASEEDQPPPEQERVHREDPGGARENA